MATGDLNNNLRKLCCDLKKMQVPSHLFSACQLASGNVAVFLSIFDYLLQWRSPALSHFINDKGLKPLSLDKNKTKFLEGVYLIFREIFNWKPPLTTAQFMSNGFLERKIIMCSEVLRLVNQKDQELEPKSSRKPILDVSHSGLKLVIKVPKYQKTKNENTGRDATKENANCVIERLPLIPDDISNACHNGLQIGVKLPKHQVEKNEIIKKDSKINKNIPKGEFLKQDMTDNPCFFKTVRLDTTESLHVENTFTTQNGNLPPTNIYNNKDPLSYDWNKFQCSVLEKIGELEARLSLSEERIKFLEKKAYPVEASVIQNQNIIEMSITGKHVENPFHSS